MCNYQEWAMDHLHISDKILKVFSCFCRSYSIPYNADKSFHLMPRSTKITLFVIILCTKFKCCYERVKFLFTINHALNFTRFKYINIFLKILKFFVLSVASIVAYMWALEFHTHARTYFTS